MCIYIYIYIYNCIYARSQKRDHCVFHGRSSLPERHVILYYVQKTFSDPTDKNVNYRLNFGVFLCTYTFCFDFFSYTVDYCNPFFPDFSRRRSTQIPYPSNRVHESDSNPISYHYGLSVKISVDVIPCIVSFIPDAWRACTRISNVQNLSQSARSYGNDKK